MEDLIIYLQFGKHGSYIWSAWGAAVLILAGTWIATNRAASKAKSELDLIRPKRPKKKDSEV